MYGLTAEEIRTLHALIVEAERMRRDAKPGRTTRAKFEGPIGADARGRVLESESEAKAGVTAERGRPSVDP